VVAEASQLERPDKERLFALQVEKFRRSNPGLLQWSEAFRVEEGDPLDFSLFPFQRELYEAFGDRDLETVDIIKSAQCGISALGISMALYAGDVWGANVAYVLPRDGDLATFSDMRLKPAIDGSAYLRTRMSSTDNKKLKQIGTAFIFFRHSQSETEAISVPVDLLIFDEYDRLNKAHLGTFERRLDSPKSLKLQRRFSNPSYPDAGIDALFKLTDRRRWLIRCPSCGKERPISWEAKDGGHFVDEERALRVCGKCKRELPIEAISGGRWVAERPKVDARGYHISKLIVPNQDIRALVRDHRKTDESAMAVHFNFDLGLPFSPAGGSLSRERILACRRDYTPPDGYAGDWWVTAGVDVGSVLHVRISRWHPKSAKAYPLFLGTIKSFEELADLWDRYGVNFGLIDWQPEERSVRGFVAKYPGRALPVKWSGEAQAEDLIEREKTDQQDEIIVARRTLACDRLVDAINRQWRLLPRNLPEEYVFQLMAPHKVIDLSPTSGQKIARYTSERADHFFLAECHDQLAREVRTGLIADAAGPAPEGLVSRRR
jgi:hypothetical protein